MNFLSRFGKKPSFFNFIFVLFSASLIIFALLVSGSYYYTENRKIKNKIVEIQREYEASQRVLIRSEVEGIAETIKKEHEDFLLELREKLKTKVYEAVAFIRFVDSLNLSEEEKIDGIRKQLRFLSFYNGSIFYFLIFKGKYILLYPKNYTFEGKDITSVFSDPHILKVLRTGEEGWYSFKTGDGLTKLVYVKYYKPLSLLIGASVNLEMIEGVLKKRMLKKLSTTYYGEGKNGYFFVLDYDGNMLTSGFNKELVGKNIIDISDKNGKKIVREFIKIVKTKGSGFVKYVWKRPSTGEFSPKITYVKGIKEWNWIVGSGLYLDDIKEKILATERQMRKDMMNVLKKVGLITIFFTFVFIFFFLFLKNLMRKDMARFIDFFKQSLYSHKKIDTEKMVYREFHNLAIYANMMLGERIRVEKELIKKEEFYSALVEDLPVMVIRFKKGCIFTFANKRYLEYFNLSMNKIIGRSFLPFINPEDRERVVKGIESITPENPIFVVQHRTVTPDGKERWMEWVNRGIFDENGNIIEYSAVGRDITEEKRKEEESVRLQKLESLGFLAGGIAHDFNNILTGILGKIELAKYMERENEELKRKLEEAEAAAMRAKDLATKLLAFSKGGEPVKEVASIADLIREEILFSLHGSNISCQFEIQKDLWAVNVDKGQIGQVIQNLVINALQAMPEGGKLIVKAENVVLSERSDPPLPPGKYIKLSIKDTGCGIPKEILRHIFDPYFTTKKTGSGLGLAIVHSIIQKHGGYITVRSELGRGTEFIIYLPAIGSVSFSEKKKEDEVIKEKGKGRILIMDDDELVVSSLKDMISFLGYEVDTARNGEEAIALYKKAMESGKPFDLVIMDLTIKGGIGGKEASRKLLSLDPNAKIVISSGYSEDLIMGEYEKFGFKGVLKKPYTMKTLATLLQSLLKEA